MFPCAESANSRATASSDRAKHVANRILMVLFLAAQLINLMGSKLLQFDGSGGTRDNPKGGAPQKLGWMLLFFFRNGLAVIVLKTGVQPSNLPQLLTPRAQRCFLGILRVLSDACVPGPREFAERARPHRKGDVF